MIPQRNTVAFEECGNFTNSSENYPNYAEVHRSEIVEQKQTILCSNQNITNAGIVLDF